MQIDKIEIKNVKGIHELEIKQSILPNRPNILVASNGYGKSSIAIAFKSLNNKGICLSKDNRYLNREQNKPFMSIHLTNGISLTADETTNSISNVFSIFVVNSQIKAIARPQRFGKTINPNPSLEIEKTIVLQKIPSKNVFEYNYSHIKYSFGKNKKLLTNISEVFENPEKIGVLENCVDFHNFDLKPYCDSIALALEKINDLNGTAGIIRNKIIENDLISLTPEFNRLRSKISTLFGYSEIDAFFAAWQYIQVHKTMAGKFRKAIVYRNYLSKKELLDSTIAELNPVSDRFKIHSEEHNGSLIVKWPKATQVSNGQRDLLTFVTRLMACEFCENDKCILIIDEIFDYLDDANLITFQYYISNLIDRFKKSKRIIFPILLTHLDPIYLKHFCFNDTKLNICYLKETKGKIGLEMKKMIQNREVAEELKLILDENYFHFNPNVGNIQFTEIFKKYRLNIDWADPKVFLKKVGRQNRAFHLEPDKNYDAVMVCLATRLQIEELVYNSLNTDDNRHNFLKTHGTKDKLLYAQRNGVIIPETYFLLGIIYNHPLHEINESTAKALSIKLENISIKKMLQNLWERKNV